MEGGEGGVSQVLSLQAGFVNTFVFAAVLCSHCACGS